MKRNDERKRKRGRKKETYEKFREPQNQIEERRQQTNHLEEEMVFWIPLLPLPSLLSLHSFSPSLLLSYLNNEGIRGRRALHLCLCLPIRRVSQSGMDPRSIITLLWKKKENEGYKRSGKKRRKEKEMKRMKREEKKEKREGEEGEKEKEYHGQEIDTTEDVLDGKEASLLLIQGIKNSSLTLYLSFILSNHNY